MTNALQKWWKWLRYEPSDPRFNAGGTIKIAVIGGGTGLATLIKGLKKYSSDISAIVTVTDDGSSSGQIRKDFDILPPGDIRQCISALAYDEKMIAHLLEYRFDKNGKSFGGHTLGNIWITALTKYFGSFEKAIETTTMIFRTAGRVLPSTLENLQLCATFEKGKTRCGETTISKTGKRINKLFLNRKLIRAYPPSVQAILAADMIIIGPGSFYTSLLPNLLIRGIREALKKTKALKIYVANCSTEKGETEGFSVGDHLKVLQEYASKRTFDFCLVNNRIVKKTQDFGKLGEVNNITTKENEILGVRIWRANVINNKNPLYHDSAKLAKVLIEMYNSLRH